MVPANAAHAGTAGHVHTRFASVRDPGAFKTRLHTRPACTQDPWEWKTPVSAHAADDIAHELEEKIACGQLAPGVRLEEVGLAHQFGVSRTPIREALRLLSASGLVELQPRKGAVVARVSLEDLLEMFEAAAEMEGVCGRLAAQRMTARERAALVRQHNVCARVAKSGDADAYYAENATFHELIYAGSHNAFLEREMIRLRRRLQPYRRLQLRNEGRIAASFSEHDRVVAAITSGDPETAQAALREHVSVQGDRFASWVAQYESLQASELEPAPRQRRRA